MILFYKSAGNLRVSFMLILHTISRRKRKEDGFSRKFHGKNKKILTILDRGNRGSDRRWHFFIFVFVAAKNNCIRVQGQL